jgi:Immunity protein 40
MKMPAPDQFLEIYRASGYSLREIGVPATGLTRADALAALDALGGANVAVVSGDVLRVCDNIPQYTYNNWRARRGLGEGFPEFAARSLQIARDYIANFGEQGTQLTLYTLVTADSEAAATSASEALSLA